MVEEKKILPQAEESLPSDLTKVKITRLTPQTNTPQNGIVSNKSPQHVIFQAEDSLVNIFRI